MIKNLYLQFSLPGWLFFVIACVLVLLIYFYYRKTLPPLSAPRRVLLSTVRSASVVLVFFLLLQPVVHLTLKQSRTAVVGVLLDNSASMKIVDGKAPRSDSLKFILNKLLPMENQDSVDFALYTFQENIKRFTGDSLNFSGRQTNISHALESIIDTLLPRNLQLVVLVSDGQFNQGANPLRIAGRSPVPIYTVGIGDTVPPKDLRISGLQVNPVAYLGEEIPLSVRFLQRGFPPGNVFVKLWQGKKLLEVKKSEIPPASFEREVRFTLAPKKAGEFRYTVEIESLKGETTARNNRKSFIVKILKRKIRALLVSGMPNFDQRMLIYTLRQSKDIQLQVLTERKGGDFFERSEQVKPDSQDVFIFLGFPTRYTRAAFLNKIFLSVQKQKRPFFLLLSRTTDLKKLAPLQAVLPVQISSSLREEKNIVPYLTTSGKLHPATRLDENPQRLLAVWHDLPPVTSFGSRLVWKKGSTALLEASGRDRGKPFPVLGAAALKGTKSLLLAAANVGSWHLQLQENPARNMFFQAFLERSLKWLVNREDIQRIQIKPRQKVFTVGETVEFSGSVLDEFYQPLNDAEVQIELKSDGFRRKDVMPGQGNRYSYRTSGLSPGTYRYTISAKQDDQQIGRTSGMIVIEPYQLELQEPAANRALLQEIAQKSGGKYFSAQKFLDHLASMSFKKQIHWLHREHILWNKTYWLAVIVLLLAAEWFLRKRWGLL